MFGCISFIKFCEIMGILSLYELVRPAILFSVHHVDLFTIQKAFEGQGCPAGTLGETGCQELLTLLIGIYQNSPNSHRTYQEAEMLADLALNLLLNLFDGYLIPFLFKYMFIDSKNNLLITFEGHTQLDGMKMTCYGACSFNIVQTVWLGLWLFYLNDYFAAYDIV